MFQKERIETCFLNNDEKGYIYLSMYKNGRDYHWNWMPFSTISFEYYLSWGYKYMGTFDIKKERCDKLKKIYEKIV